MSYIDLNIAEEIATITIHRPPVNALNDQVVEELSGVLDIVESPETIRSIVFTGKGSFFSFGFDVPGFMSYTRDDFEQYLLRYSNLIKRIFIFPKPVIAALNGHTVAAGTVLALACDHRIMQSGKAKIALNEMTFGSTVFSSVTEPLKYAVGQKRAEQILYSGQMYSAGDALSLGLVDMITAEDEFEKAVSECAGDFALKDTASFASVKRMLRHETLNNIEKVENETISEFVDIWYSESTRKNLEKIEIRG